MNEKQLIINTMDEAKYRELARRGRIRGDELNIVDDDSKNRTTIPSYDLFKTRTDSLQTQITDASIRNLELAYDKKSCKIQLFGKKDVITELDAKPFVSDNYLSAAEYRDGNLILYVVMADGKTNEISVSFPVDSELNQYSGNPIQNKAVYAEFEKKVNESELSNYYTKAEADETFLSAHQDISRLATRDELTDGLGRKLDKDDDSVVKYTPHPSEAHPDRKVIILNNHDEITGTLKDGSDGVNLVMLSEWDVADFGSKKVHLNLNTKDVVTINDKLTVLTNEDKAIIWDCGGAE